MSDDEENLTDEQKRARIEIAGGMGRLKRELEKGKSIEQILREEESGEGWQTYLNRNQEAIDQAGELFDNPEFQELMKAKAEASTDEEKAAIDLKLKEFAAYNVDLDALHRHVRANNRRFVQEGMLPPEADQSQGRGAT